MEKREREREKEVETESFSLITDESRDGIKENQKSTSGSEKRIGLLRLRGLPIARGL